MYVTASKKCHLNSNCRLGMTIQSGVICVIGSEKISLVNSERPKHLINQVWSLGIVSSKNFTKNHILHKITPFSDHIIVLFYYLDSYVHGRMLRDGVGSCWVDHAHHRQPWWGCVGRTSRSVLGPRRSRGGHHHQNLPRPLRQGGWVWRGYCLDFGDGT